MMCFVLFLFSSALDVNNENKIICHDLTPSRMGSDVKSDNARTIKLFQQTLIKRNTTHLRLDISSCSIFTVYPNRIM